MWKRCGKDFTTSQEVRKHILAEHRSHRPCSKFFSPIPSCRYGNKCHYSHTKAAEGKLVCYKCGAEENNIDELMAHRKNAHRQFCRNAMNNTCQFDQTTCYLNHPAGEAQKQGPPPANGEDFRVASPPQPPDPSRNQMPPQATQQPAHMGFQKNIEAMTAAITSLASSQATVLQAIQALLQNGAGPMRPPSC